MKTQHGLAQHHIILIPVFFLTGGLTPVSSEQR